MRILHMIGSLEMGGAQTMLMSLYRAMDRNKIQFDFIVDCDANVFSDEIDELGGKIFRLPKFNGINYKEVHSAWHDFFTNHPEYKVLHSHVRSYASLYLPIAKSHGVKTIIHSHNTSNGHGMKALIKQCLQYPLRYQADYFFGCSEIAGQWLFGKKIVKSDRYFMLKNAVDIERFSFNPEVREKIRREIGASEDTLVLGHVGRMNPQKNHRFLIDCVKKMVAQRENVKLVLLGDGELHDEVAGHIQESGLAEQVHMLGVKSNVEEYFCAFDCFLLPSLHEGLPVVVVEAQANGLPCIIADTITREVNLSELVQYCPIDQGEDVWVKAILNSMTGRKDVSTQIIEQGFSVKDSAMWLYNFYNHLI